jgi:CRP-like cAMP-binding protein
MATSRYLELFLGRRGALRPEERDVLRALPAERLTFSDGQAIVSEGAAPDGSCLLVSGMAMRSHRLGAAETVVSALHVPGDFVDLHAVLLDHIDHDIVSVGPSVVEFIPAEPIREITRSHPHLARLLWLSTLIDAKMHRMWIALRGGLLAHERLAHLLCELHARLAMVGLSEGGRFAMPMDQRALAAILGYSVVHTNRAVQHLRGRGLLDWQAGVVHLPDPAALAKLASFDPAYLEPHARPR